MLMLLALPMLTGGTPLPAPGQAGAPETTAERVEAFVGDLSTETTASGSLEAARAAALSMSSNETVQEVLVEVGDSVRAGDPLVRLDTEALQRDVESARQALAAREADLADLAAPATDADLAAAEANVTSAQAQLDDLLDGPDADEVAAAEASLSAAQADLSAASARLASASGAPDPEAVRAAQIGLDLAQQAATTAAEQHSTILVTEPNQFISAEDLVDMEAAARAQAQQANADLAAAQATYDELVNGDPGTVASAQAGVAAAAAQRDAAQAQLALKKQGASEAEIASARSTLAQTQLKLEQLREGASDSQRVQAETAAEMARISLQRAERALDEATLRSPFDGLITVVNARQGNAASGVLVELIDPASLEVVLDVDEADIAQVQPGQRAELSFETWPDQTVAAVVSAIAPRTTGGDLAAYRVYLRLEPSDLPLRAGMTADASLSSGELAGVLLLPNAAIRADRQAGTYSVSLITVGADGAETTVETPVTIGMRDRRYTQITGGLGEGDIVLVGNDIPAQEFGTGSALQPGGPMGENGN